MSESVNPKPAHKSFHVALAIVFGAAITGYFMGMQPPVTPPAWHPRTIQLAGSEEILPAMPYAELPGRKYGPNRAWTNSLSKLPPEKIDLLAPVVNDAAAKQATLAKRANARAYAGAPPVIPHPVRQQSVASCLACHGEGRTIGSIIAPRVSHKVIANCTQCHVESDNKSLPALDEAFTEPAAANGFAGIREPSQGARAWKGAPPVIPHGTFMRGNCASCHGPLGHAGIRSTHVWRQNCLQCHAASAVLDQQPMFNNTPPALDSASAKKTSDGR
jgi:cytochrome c-type protein NapB